MSKKISHMSDLVLHLSLLGEPSSLHFCLSSPPWDRPHLSWIPCFPTKALQLDKAQTLRFLATHLELPNASREKKTAEDQLTSPGPSFSRILVPLVLVASAALWCFQQMFSILCLAFLLIWGSSDAVVYPYCLSWSFFPINCWQWCDKISYCDYGFFYLFLWINWLFISIFLCCIIKFTQIEKTLISMVNCVFYHCIVL